ATDSLNHRDLHSIPTRRSSDLETEIAERAAEVREKIAAAEAEVREVEAELKRQENQAAEAEIRLSFVDRTIVQQDAMVRTDHLRSEEHTSELQSRSDLVCRLLL